MQFVSIELCRTFSNHPQKKRKLYPVPHHLIDIIVMFVYYSPTKHVVVGGAAPLQVPPQQYVPVPVSMVEPTSAQRMLLTNRVQTNTVAWPQGGRQVLVPSWSQQAAPHSLIVDSAPFLNMEEIYPKHHLNLPRHELKKESPVHHLPLVLHYLNALFSLFLYPSQYIIINGCVFLQCTAPW